MCHARNCIPCLLTSWPGADVRSHYRDLVDLGQKWSALLGPACIHSAHAWDAEANASIPRDATGRRKTFQMSWMHFAFEISQLLKLSDKPEMNFHTSTDICWRWSSKDLLGNLSLFLSGNWQTSLLMESRALQQQMKTDSAWPTASWPTWLVKQQELIVLREHKLKWKESGEERKWGDGQETSSEKRKKPS